MDLEEELKSFLEGFRSLRNLESFVTGNSCCSKKCCEEDEEENDCPISLSLKKDYKDFTKWVFGTESPGDMSKKEARKTWIVLHPDLPIPRILQTFKSVPSDVATACLFMDGYRLYLD